MHAAAHRLVTRDRVLLFLVGSLYVAVALLAHVAIPEPTPLQNRGLHLVEAAGGLAIGACLPGCLTTTRCWTPVRVACALGVALVFYVVGPWGRVW